MIFIEKRECYAYPNVTNAFSPSNMYPEYLWNDKIAKQENTTYDMVRSTLFGLGLDKENYGTEKWNPLKSIVKSGDTVLIKPNMVMHENVGIGDMNGLITHPSVVRAVLDYVCIALSGKGKIILGDAPMQSCDFSTLIEQQGYERIIDFYKEQGVSIELCDFREIASKVKNGRLRVQNQLDSERSYSVDLKDSSFHAEKDDSFSLRRITNYDYKDLIAYHQKDKHVYKIIDYALQADVIINLPKPKTHRKAGMTGALKNMVGVIVNKNCLPHHMKGAAVDLGDEYCLKNGWKKMLTTVQEKIDVVSGQKGDTRVFGLRIMRRFFSKAVKKTDKDSFSEGSWYGNDTIWRTILDINRILIYANKEGELKDIPQRKLFVLSDMLISGEGEGPLLPENKKVGAIVAGDIFWEFDNVIAEIMGFKQEKIPYISNANQIDKYSILGIAKNKNDISIKSNIKGIKYIEDIRKMEFSPFKPTAGWLGHIEKQ